MKSYMTVEDDIPCECGNCSWTGKASDTQPIDDIEERISPGEIVPVGECPTCGALAHYQDAKAPEGTAQRKQHDMRKAMEALRPKAGAA